MSKVEIVTICFGCSSAVLCACWAAFSWQTTEKHMTVVLLCYAVANVSLLWPLIRKVVF